MLKLKSLYDSILEDNELTILTKSMFSDRLQESKSNIIPLVDGSILENALKINKIEGESYEDLIPLYKDQYLINIKENKTKEFIVNIVKSLLFKSVGVILYNYKDALKSYNLMHPISMYYLLKGYINLNDDGYEYLVVNKATINDIKNKYPDSYLKDTNIAEFFDKKVIYDYLACIEIKNNYSVNTNILPKLVHGISFSYYENVGIKDRFSIHKLNENNDNIKNSIIYQYCDLYSLNGKLYPKYSVFLLDYVNIKWYRLYNNCSYTGNLKVDGTTYCTGELSRSSEEGINSLRVENRDSVFSKCTHSKYLYNEIITYHTITMEIINGQSN